MHNNYTHRALHILDSKAAEIRNWQKSQEWVKADNLYKEVACHVENTEEIYEIYRHRNPAKEAQNETSVKCYIYERIRLIDIIERGQN